MIALALLSRYRRNTKGSTAIEFAMVSPVILLTVLAIIETGWIFIRMAMLDHAMHLAGRFVYTGAASHGEMDKDAIKEYVCEQMRFIDTDGCFANTALDMTVIDDFSSIPSGPVTCTNSDTQLAPSEEFDPGAGSQIVFMRVCVMAKLLMPTTHWAANIPKDENGEFRMVSSLIFINEPF